MSHGGLDIADPGRCSVFSGFDIIVEEIRRTGSAVSFC